VSGSKELGFAAAGCAPALAGVAALAAVTFAGGFAGDLFAVAGSTHGAASANTIPANSRARLDIMRVGFIRLENT
jgi:hypothetical protein